MDLAGDGLFALRRCTCRGDDDDDDDSTSHSPHCLGKWLRTLNKQGTCQLYVHTITHEITGTKPAAFEDDAEVAVPPPVAPAPAAPLYPLVRLDDLQARPTRSRHRPMCCSNMPCASRRNCTGRPCCWRRRPTGRCCWRDWRRSVPLWSTHGPSCCPWPSARLKSRTRPVTCAGRVCRWRRQWSRSAQRVCEACATAPWSSWTARSARRPCPTRSAAIRHIGCGVKCVGAGLNRAGRVPAVPV